MIHPMTTSTQIPLNRAEEAEEQDSVASASSGARGGRGGKGPWAFMRRPIALLSAAAMIGVTTLGVITLGTLYSSDPSSVAASSATGTTPGGGSRVAGDVNAATSASLGAKSYRIAEGGELVSE
jgi:hypothetical protein